MRSSSSRGSKAMAAVDRALHIAFGGGVTGVQRLMVAAAFAAAAWVVVVSSAVSDGDTGGVASCAAIT